MTKLIANDTVAMFPTPTEKSRKIGTYGRWIAGVYEDKIFIEATGYTPSAMYPDMANVEVYTEPRYVELELLSPEKQLKRGEALSNDVTWQLIEKPKDATPEDVVRLIRGALGK
jgi:hypothetical protein